MCAHTCTQSHSSIRPLLGVPGKHCSSLSGSNCLLWKTGWSLALRRAGHSGFWVQPLAWTQAKSADLALLSFLHILEGVLLDLSSCGSQSCPLSGSPQCLGLWWEKGPEAVGMFLTRSLHFPSNCGWIQVCVSNVQWGRTLWNIKVWNTERFTAGPNKENEPFVLKRH